MSSPFDMILAKPEHWPTSLNHLLDNAKTMCLGNHPVWWQNASVHDHKMRSPTQVISYKHGSGSGLDEGNSGLTLWILIILEN